MEDEEDAEDHKGFRQDCRLPSQLLKEKPIHLTFRKNGAEYTECEWVLLISKCNKKENPLETENMCVIVHC